MMHRFHLRSATAFLAALALTACSGDASAGDQARAADRSTASQPKAASTSPAAISMQKAQPMSASKPCGTSNLERSICMMELMLEDIRTTYDWPSGGGVSSIKAESSTSYTVTLPQEGRADLFTYEFAVTDKAVSIKSKTPGTQTY